MAKSKRAKRANKSRKRKVSGHHIIPRSRGGRDVSVVRISTKAHKAYHLLFGNALPYEAQLLIDKYWSTPEVDDTVELPRQCKNYYRR